MKLKLPKLRPQTKKQLMSWILHKRRDCEDIHCLFKEVAPRAFYKNMGLKYLCDTKQVRTREQLILEYLYFIDGTEVMEQLILMVVDGSDYEYSLGESADNAQENHIKFINRFNAYFKDDGFRIAYKEDPHKPLNLSIWIEPLVEELQTNLPKLEELLKEEGGMDHLLRHFKNLQSDLSDFGHVTDYSKSILEGVCKCILSELDSNYSENIKLKFNDFFGETVKVIKLNKDSNKKILDYPEESKAIWGIFSSLKNIQENIRDLRASEGPISHGKGKGFNAAKFQERHSRLLANSTITLCSFLFETYLFHKNLRNKKEIISFE